MVKRVIDLQLFADDEEEIEEIVDAEVEETDVDEEEEPTEEEPETTEEETDTDTDEEEETDTDDEHNSVPLAKYMAEKKKRQEYERVLAEQQSERKKLELTQQFVDQGYPEATAQFHADQEIKKLKELESLKDRQLDYDIKDLAKSDSFYSDAVTYEDEIKELMKQHDVDAERAYMLLRGKTRMREVKTQKEQLDLHKRRAKSKKKVPTATSTQTKSRYQLDDNDKKALAELKKAMPDADWTPKKYYELMKS